MKISNQRGFLTLEILLAMAIFVLFFSAIVLLLSGAQSFASDSQINSEALNIAEQSLEQARILALKDFRLLNSTTTSAGFYAINLSVKQQPDFLTKLAVASVSWNVGNGRNLAISLSKLIADYNGTAGNDTCDSNLTGDWTQSLIKKVIDFSDFAENASSTYAISDIDAYKNKLYVAIGGTANKTDSTFYIFDINNPFLPSLLNKIDNNPAAMAGINGIAINGDYAYVASAGSKQFQIIDVAALPPKIISPPKITDGGSGESIFYKNGYVYLGLASANDVPEFHIFDVKNASSAVEVGHWPSGGGLKHGINDIYVRGNYAYLAHPTDADGSGGCPQEQLTVLDISNPGNPQRVSGFYYNGSSGGNGKSLHLVGDKLYFGRTASNISGTADSIPEFYILDNSIPQSINNAALGSLPLSTAVSVNGVLARDYLAFLLGRTSLQIFKIDNPENISSWGNIALNASAGESFEPSFDCEGNNFVVGSNNNQKGYLSVITGK